MAYEVIMPYHLHMPSYFLETFTEYPYVDGRIHEMTALLVRRARLEALNLTAIRVGYKYLFVEPGQIGKAKVKEG